MGLTLRNVMKLGKFNECEVIAGHKGLSRVVERVTIMEVPEIVQWLKNKELILTSLFAIKDDYGAQSKLIQELYAADASALAIKPFQFMDKIPDAIIDHANELDFPIIFIPDHVKYLDILYPVMHQIFNDKVVLQEDVEHASTILREISLNNQGVDVFAENLEYLIKNDITIESEFPYIRSTISETKVTPLSNDEIYELSVLQRPLQINREYDDKTVACIVSPIIVDGDYYGNITSWSINNEHLSSDLVILEEASTLLSLEFLKLKVKHDVAQQYENDFMRELLFSQNIRERSILEWGEKYNITKDTSYICMLFSAGFTDSQNKDYEKLKDDKINAIVKKMLPDALAGYIRNGICVITPASGDNNLNHVFQELYDRIQQFIGSDYTLFLGVGRQETGPQGIQKSFQQADQALYLLETINHSSGMIYYDDLGVYRLINLLRDSKELRDFYNEKMAGLLNNDKKNELFHTIRTYFHHNEILKTTAESLYIHVNTLKYRLKKIEEITGCDLKTTEGKINLFLSLKIHDIMTRE